MQHERDGFASQMQDRGKFGACAISTYFRELGLN